MKRKMTRVLEQWRGNPDKVALVIAGSYGIGKTYVIEEFCKEHYSSYCRLDLAEKGTRDIFRDSIRASKILDEISVRYPKFQVIEGDTVLFLDGIHLCRDAWSALKPLVCDRKVDVIAADSMMYVEEEGPTKPSPMGYEIVYRMYPMDFEEYLWAVGLSEDDTAGIRHRIKDGVPFDEDELNRLFGHHERYLEVGGLPAVVEASLGESDADRVEELQAAHLSEYRRDIFEYAPRPLRSRALACLDSMPDMLSKRGKKFVYSRAEKRTERPNSVGKQDYMPSVEWIGTSGLAVPCQNVIEPIPRLESELEGSFKLYCFDTGILSAMLVGYPVSDRGVFTENYVADMLTSCGYRLFYYERNEVDRIEIDFMIHLGGELTAIEVESGKNRRSGTMRKLRKNPYYNSFPIDRFIKFENGNVFTDELGVEHYPIFAAAFMDELDRSPELPESFEPLPLNL